MVSDNVAAAKMNGLGNAILIMDMRGRRERLSADFIRLLAQNPQSAFDQLMVLESGKTENADNIYSVAIYNADGSEAGACGNGARCLAEWLYRQDSAVSSFHFFTKGGQVRAERLKNGQVKADMGAPHFEPRAVPLSFSPENMLCVPLARLLPPGAAAAYPLFPQSAAVLSVGNPHAVFFSRNNSAASDKELAEFGMALEHSPAFPQGVNVSLAQILSPDAMRLRVWERGAGLTRACGTAACAAQAAAHKAGLTKTAAEIILPGGQLTVSIESGRCLMMGAAEYEYGGAVNLKTAAFLRDA